MRDKPTCFRCNKCVLNAELNIEILYACVGKIEKIYALDVFLIGYLLLHVYTLSFEVNLSYLQGYFVKESGK